MYVSGSTGPGRGSDFLTQKERIFHDADCHLFIQPSLLKNPLCAKPCAGIRDEMEIETQVLSSGADHLVRESGQETGDGGPGYGGLCWRGTERAHCEATPNAALGKGAYGKLPGGGDNWAGI